MQINSPPSPRIHSCTQFTHIYNESVLVYYYRNDHYNAMCVYNTCLCDEFKKMFFFLIIINCVLYVPAVTRVHFDKVRYGMRYFWSTQVPSTSNKTVESYSYRFRLIIAYAHYIIRCTFVHISLIYYDIIKNAYYA